MDNNTTKDTDNMNKRQNNLRRKKRRRRKRIMFASLGLSIVLLGCTTVFLISKTIEAYRKLTKSTDAQGNSAQVKKEMDPELATEIGNASTEAMVDLPNSSQLPEQNGLIKEDGHLYFYEMGERVTDEFISIGDKKYYFDKKGRAIKGKKKTIDHYRCYFDKKGVIYRQIDLDQKMVALTYDDGPSINTDTILDTLEENNAVATFFIVGNRANTYKEKIKRQQKLGCEVANHTYNHQILTKTNSGRIVSEISRTNDAIQKITGSKPLCMRPPGGAINPSVRKNANMPLILWSVDTLDWKTRDSSSTISKVMSTIQDGDIVLMHDLYEATANASQTIIPKLIEEGYQLVTVSELADCRGQKLKKGNKYFNFRP